MKKIKAAFYVFYKSLTDENYYKDIIKMDLGFSIKYIFVLALLATAITLPKTVKPLLTDFKETLDSISTALVNFYPEDLVITVKDGEIFINQPEPYFVELPGDLNNFEREDGSYPRYLVVFDSLGELSDLETYNTIVLVNRKNILVKESNSIEVYPLKDAPDTEITKEKFVEGYMKVDAFIKVLPYLVLVIVVVFSLIYYFGFRLVYLFLVGFVLYLIGKNIKNQNLEYKKYYMVAIHAMTMPLLVEVLTSVLSINMPIPFWFLMLNTLVGYFAVNKLSENVIDSENHL